MANLVAKKLILLKLNFMKTNFNLKVSVVFTILSLSAMTIFAQFASKNAFAKPEILLEKNKDNRAQRVSFVLNYGFHPISVKASAVELKYTDESPSPDVLKQKIDLLDSKGALGLSGGIEWQSKRNLMHRICFGGGKNGSSNTRSNYFDFGMGYAFGSERFQFYPMIDFIASNATIKFGDFENKTGYAEINNVSFTNDKISTELNMSFAGFRPSVGFHFAITKNIGIQANVGYLMSNPNGSTEIKFSAPNPDTDAESQTLNASEKISEANVEFLVNSKRTTTRPDIFSGRGLSWNIGITLGKNRMFDGK